MKNVEFKTEEDMSLDYKFMFIPDKDDRETAHRIAEMYLKKYPRSLSYAVYFESDTGDERSYYYELSDEEIEIVRKWEASQELEEDNMSLTNYLEFVAAEDLLSFRPMGSYCFLQYVDLNDTLKYTSFSVQYRNEDGSFSPVNKIGIDLSDDEYIELLEELLLSKNHLSVNMLVDRKPKLAQHIMRALIRTDDFEICNPFVCDMDELKSIVHTILDPSIDILHLTTNEDKNIREFIKHL